MIESSISYIELLPSGILRVEKKKGVELNPKSLDDNHEIYKSLLNGEKGLFLIVLGDDCDSSEQFRTKIADPDRIKLKIAEALVVSSLGNRLESDFYISYYKPEHPVKLFSKEEDAIKWLLSFRT